MGKASSSSISCQPQPLRLHLRSSPRYDGRANGAMVSQNDTQRWRSGHVRGGKDDHDHADADAAQYVEGFDSCP